MVSPSGIAREDSFELNPGPGTGTHTGAGHGGPGRSGGRVPAPWWHHPLTWLTLGVVLVLVGVTASPGPPPQQVGIIDRVAEPVQQWETQTSFAGQQEDEDTVEGGPEVHLAEDTVLYLTGEEVAAFDTADGSRRWQIGGTDLRCHLSEPGLLCADGHAEDAELVRLDLTDGEVGRESRPGLAAAIGVEDDIAVIHAQQEDTLVERVGPDGERGWSQVLHSDDAWPQERDLSISMEVIGQHLLVAVRSGAKTASGIFDTSTGEAQDLPRGAQLQDLRSSPVPQRDVGWQVIDADDRIYPIEPDGTIADAQAPSNLVVDDDAGSSIHFVTSSGSLSARSEEGEELWTRAEHDPPTPWARLGEVLITIGADGLLGLDLATGAELWESQILPSLHTFSDGEILVQLVVGVEDRIHIVGIEAATGAELFDLPASDGSLPTIATGSDRLVLLTDAELSLWAW